VTVSAGRERAEVHGWDLYGDELDSPASPPPGAEPVQPLAGPATQDTAEQVRRLAGLGAPAPRELPPEHPDVSGVAEGLGLA
jgi:hypothetical protein